ncbi:MAG: response regulator [Flaviramulus sp.]|nr:response regulator [Flaviramulus sp.]NNC49774.1 response regulator [Flaviramulus sp.]
MKTKLLFSFLLISAFFYSFGNSERDIIHQIDSINTLALNYYHKNDIINSFSEFNKAVKIADSLNDDYGNAVAHFTLGKIYMNMQNYASAESSFFKMQKLSKKIDDNYLIASSYLNLGKLYGKIKTSKDVLPYLNKAYEYALKNEVNDINNKDDQHRILFNINMNLCEVYLNRNITDEVLTYLLRAKNNLEHLPANKYNTSKFNYFYGNYYLKKNLYNLANEKFEIAKNALIFQAETQENNLLISKIYKDYSFSLQKTGKSELAYTMLLQRESAIDKYNNEEVLRQDNIIKSKLQIEIYKQEAKWANEGRILQEQITESTKNFNIYLTIAAFLLLISFITLLINYNTKIRLSNTLKTQNKKLEIAKDLAEESSKLKSKFISNVSHELRTPLYGVVGLTSIMLENNNLNKRDTKYLKSLKYSGDYLLNLINDILHVGKIETNKVELNNSSVNIKSLIQDVTDSFDYSLDESNNKIHILIDDCLPEFVMCDKLRLTQVLFNLIGNSIKFTQNGNIYIKAILQDSNNDEAKIRFEVNDDGPGIPKEKQESIFENFTQLSENSNTNYQGAGLGLSITNKIVALFDSKIELDSEVGIGSTFGFVISFKIDHKAIEAIKIKKDDNKLANSDSKNIRILIAEDNKINQIVTSNLLKKQNFQFDIVDNGLKAYEAFKSNKYDLILMDINMPVMDGYDATMEIRKVNNQIPIIALTASHQDELLDNKLDIGFDDIITKPFDNDLFFSSISRLLERNKLNNNKGKVFELAS